MNRYQYEGPVMFFDNCIQHNWKATTTAISELKAKSNLAYRYKKEHGLTPNSRITLPGRIKQA